MNNVAEEGALVWAHLGDLHITGAQQANYRDFLTIVETVNAQLSDQIDFCVLRRVRSMRARPAHRFTLSVEATDAAGRTDTRLGPNRNGRQW